MITVFGSINVDLVTRVLSLPQPGETVLAESCQTLFGGKGANQAVAAARASVRSGAVRMVGAVGDDGFGRDSTANLKACGVDTSGIVTCDAPTGCAFIQVEDSGENVITVASGANRHLMAKDLAAQRFTAGDWLVLQMEVPLPESTAAARKARNGAARVIANLAPVPSGLTGEALRGLCAVTDVLIVNEHEALTAAACLGGSLTDAIDAALLVAGHTNCTVIVTLGAAGAAAALPDGTLERVAAPQVTPLDTTGAGDTFVGTLAAFLSEGVELRSAMSLACKSASLACLSLGAQTAMPTREAILA